MGEHGSDKREEFELLSLVVDELRLFLNSRDVSKLAADARVSNRDCQSWCFELQWCLTQDRASDGEHGRVQHTDISTHRNVSISVNFDEPLKHLISRNSNLVHN